MCLLCYALKKIRELRLSWKFACTGAGYPQSANDPSDVSLILHSSGVGGSFYDSTIAVISVGALFCGCGKKTIGKD